MESSSESEAEHPPLSQGVGESEMKKRRHGLETIKPALQSSNDSRELKSQSDTVIAGDEAFRQSELYSIFEPDSQSQYARIREIQKKIDSGELDEGVYRGMKAYRAYIQPDDERKLAKAKVTGALGPQKSTGNVKSTITLDYQMDVCKDYKESGYCGFGDSCKFLHDRSDYKSGWQLDSEWSRSQRSTEKEQIDKFQRKAEKRRARIEKMRQDAIAQGLDPDLVVQLKGDGGEESEDSETNSDPTTQCCVCLKKWADCQTSACVTICGHYFCESCFLSTSTRMCKSCGNPTQGIFNSPN